MRLLFELLLVGALIAVAWEKSYHELVGEAVPMLAKQPAAPVSPTRRALPANGVAAAPAQAGAADRAAVPSPTISSGSWMWEKNRPGSLDRKGSPTPPRP